MLNLRLPLAKWLPWLSTSLIKACHNDALQKSVTTHVFQSSTQIRRELTHASSPNTAQSAFIRSLAASYGPSPADCNTSLNRDGTRYGPTVHRRASRIPQGDWDERVRIYGEGLALGEWHPNYPGYQAPTWKTAPEGKRKGQFSYPVHVMFGMRDVALDPRIVLDGVEGFMLDAEKGMRKADFGGEDGVEVQVVGRSSVTKLWGCGHWAMLGGQGTRALERLLERISI